MSGRLTFRRLLGSPLTNREQGERVDVAVRVGSQPDAEMDVRLEALGLTARADCPDDFAFDDCGADRQADRPEVNEGDRIPVLGTDRQAEPFVREASCE